jgi:hypothetical protein
MPAADGVRSPLVLPDEFWTNDDVHTALTTQDVGALFRLVHKRGISETRIGAATENAQSDVSDYIRGKKRAMALAVFQRVADGLAMPDHARRTFFGFPPGVLDLVDALYSDIERITGAPDVVRAYPMRGLITRNQWNDIIRGSHDQLWLYGMAEMGFAIDDQVPGILTDAAAAGCEVRILLLDPTYAGTDDIDIDEGNPAGTLKPRITAALARFNAVRRSANDRINIRVYDAPPTLSIVRGDDRMLVTPYMRFFVGSNSPTFELANRADAKTFDRYTRHFENMWTQAKEWKV